MNENDKINKDTKVNKTPEYQLRSAKKHIDKTYKVVTVKPRKEFYNRIFEYCQKNKIAVNKFFLIAAEKLLNDI